MDEVKCPLCGEKTRIDFGSFIAGNETYNLCEHCGASFPLNDAFEKNDPVNNPSHYVGKIECIDYLRDKLTQEEFTGFCMGNVLKYSSRWRKKDGVQDLKKAKVYLEWAIETAEKENANG